MNRSILGVIVGCALAMSSCSVRPSYPPEWHSASNSIRVFGAKLEKVVEVPASGSELTLLDLVLGLGPVARDVSHVVVSRRSGSDVLRIDIDVRDMLRTGNTDRNLQMRPGDVVEVAG